LYESRFNFLPARLLPRRKRVCAGSGISAYHRFRQEESIKKVLFAILLLAPVVGWAEKSDSADYTIDVQVQSSRLAVYFGDVTRGPSVNSWRQGLSTIIGGKKYELLGPSKGTHLLRAGNYMAKILSRKAEARTNIP
jgi:hypothetical protein